MNTVHIKKDLIDATLATPPVQGKRLLEPLKSFAKQNNFPVNILEDTNVVSEAEVHKDDGDLWHCLEGTVTFVTGGTLTEPQEQRCADGTPNAREWKGKSITGGTETVLHPGDWLWIPAGEPHLHRADGTARLIIIKIPRRAHSH